MSKTNMVTVDGIEAAAHVAHKTNEVIAIYPITPSSGMGELSDEYSANGRTNLWGTIPQVTEMQHEGGAISTAWRTADRLADDNLYLLPGSAADDPQHV